MAEKVPPEMRAADLPVNVPMPRFRGSASSPMKLTEVIHRILKRMMANAQPFAVFAINGRVVISNVNTDRFKALQRRAPDKFVGTYGRGLKIIDALEDLRDHFTDEDVNGIA